MSVFGFAIVAVLVIMWFSLVWLARDAAIERCEKDGGTPVPPHLLSNTPWHVPCIDIHGDES